LLHRRRRINREIIEQDAALARPRFDSRHVEFEQADALEVQPRASYCLPRKSRSKADVRDGAG